MGTISSRSTNQLAPLVNQLAPLRQRQIWGELVSSVTSQTFAILLDSASKNSKVALKITKCQKVKL